ncbi:MAG TPA: sugar phosphate nucleotidyltransferase [Vicinamibacterales bacterium]
MAVWGIVPAAGAGTRIQPLAFSKELLPVGFRRDGSGVERPRAVSEFLVERLAAGGADRLCFVIAPGKSDILEYYGGSALGRPVCYVVQPRPSGLCDAVFRAAPLIRDDDRVLVGLPDTVWFPIPALRTLPGDRLGLLLFPSERPELFDAVETDGSGAVRRIDVKQPLVRSRWIWGAMGMPGHVLLALRRLWHERSCRDEYLGTLIHAFIEAGGSATGVRTGRAYVDVGTPLGYRQALELVEQHVRPPAVGTPAKGGAEQDAAHVEVPPAS